MPVMLPSMIGIILRARQARYIIMADGGKGIATCLHKEDMDFTNSWDFLWLGYNDAKNSLEYENNLHENNEPNISIQQNLINHYQNIRRKFQRLWKIWQEESKKFLEMGRVEKLIKVKDGLCRSVVVRMSNDTRLLVL
ncbi:unnamed protein product [Onchocerca flexuosa]|uniref:Uncharacterized protein n=1 Tax=Onchocerca flexuosa TaxID=387005 RepID=A0A183HFH7_9BILA|nr:unnamed protein product [Onchocerca flexuosa]